MLSPKINSYKNRLLLLSFFILFGSLSVSKGLQNICEITILILSADLLFSRKTWKQIEKKRSFFVFILFYFVLILGLLYTQNLHYGLKVIRHNHRWLIIPFLMYIHRDLIRNWHRHLLLTFVLTASLASFITIIFYYLPTDSVRYLIEHLPFVQEYPKLAHASSFGIYSPFIDRLQFSNLIGIAFITGIFTALRRWYAYWVLASLIPIGYCMIILGGRGGQVALLGSVIVYFLLLLNTELYPRLRQKIGKRYASLLLALAFLIILLAPLFLYQTNDELRSRYNQMKWELSTFVNGTYENHDYVHFTSVRRLISWKHMYSVFKENPVFGVGTGDVLEEIEKKYQTDKYKFPVNIHSQYLYYACGTGMVGLMTFLFCCIYWVRRLQPQPVFLFGLAFLSFYGVSMLFNASLVKQIDLMAFTSMTSFLSLLRE